MKISADDLLMGGKVEIKEYGDREIIENLLNNCDEKQLKVIKEVLIAICPNFEDLKK